MHILDLKEAREHLEPLARWHQDEWSRYNPGETLKGRIERMHTYLAPAFIPSMYLALDGRLLGSAAVVARDMDIRPDLMPWLASVYVAPEFRGRGIGSRLVNHVVAQARASGVETLYLFTPDQRAFYERLGWALFEEGRYHGDAVSLMSIRLRD